MSSKTGGEKLFDEKGKAPRGSSSKKGSTEPATIGRMLGGTGGGRMLAVAAMRGAGTPAKDAKKFNETKPASEPKIAKKRTRYIKEGVILEESMMKKPKAFSEDEGVAFMMSGEAAMDLRKASGVTPEWEGAALSPPTPKKDEDSQQAFETEVKKLTEAGDEESTMTARSLTASRKQYLYEKEFRAEISASGSSSSSSPSGLGGPAKIEVLDGSEGPILVEDSQSQEPL